MAEFGNRIQQSLEQAQIFSVKGTTKIPPHVVVSPFLLHSSPSLALPTVQIFKMLDNYALYLKKRKKIKFCLETMF